MKIDVISDTICPWCFIGKRRLERALAEHPDLEPEIVWHPFQLNPDMPPEGMDREMYLQIKFGGPTRAKEVYQVIADAASGEALDFKLDDIGRTPSTLNSHRLVHFAESRGRQQAVVEGLFKAYFENGADVGSIEILATIARDAGLEYDEVTAYLESDKDVELIRMRDQHARTMGVNGVPCFIVNDKYAISGAQDPEVFQQVFAVAQQDEKAAEIQAAAE